MGKLNKKKVLVAVLAIILVAAAIILYQLNKPHKQASVKADIEVTAGNLAATFETDEAAANKTYLDKLLAVTGQVTEVSTNLQGYTVIVLKGTDMSGISCTLLERGIVAEKNTTLRLQGFCNGYLTDVVLNRCVIMTLE